MKYIASFLFSVSAFSLFSGSVLAQSSSTTSIKQQPKQEYAVVADINVTDVAVIEKSGVYTGSFALQDKMGMQNDIVYGIIVYNKDNAIVDVQKLGEEKFLREGEIKRYSFSYNLPASIASLGATVTLQAFTKNGLILGSQTLGEKEVTQKTVSNNLSCSSGNGECSTVKSTSLTVQAFANSPFGEPFTSVTYTTKDGQTSNPGDLVQFAKPGMYYLLIEDTGYHTKRMIPFTAKGEFITIQNISVDYTGNNEVAVIGTLLGTVFQGTVVTTVKDLKGSVVIEKTSPFNGGLISETFTSPVKEGTVHVKILAKDDVSKVLAEQESSFSLLSYQEYTQSQVAQAKAPEKKSKGIVFAGLVTIFFALLAVVYYVVKNKNSINNVKVTMLVLFAVMSFYGSGLRSTHALTIALFHYNYSFSPDFLCTTAVSANKSSYAPNESMTMSGSSAFFVNQTGTSPGGWVVSGTCDMAYPTATFDTAVGGAMTQIMTTGLQTLPVSGSYTAPAYSNTFTAPAAAGSHYLAFRVTITPSGSPLTQGPNTATGNETFTVAAAPTVNVYFSSLLRSIKNFLIDSVSAGTR